MLLIGYNRAEGKGYIEEQSKNPEEKYEELLNKMINKEIVCGKVRRISGDNEILYLDFGSEMRGIVYKNFIPEKNIWMQRALLRNYVNVELESWDSEKKVFICNRKVLQKKCFEEQKQNYKPGTSIEGKILGYTPKVVIIDIGGGILTALPRWIMKDSDEELESMKGTFKPFIISEYNEKHETFDVSIKYQNLEVLNGVVKQKVDNGYLVFIPEEKLHGLLRTYNTFEFGDKIKCKKIKNDGSFLMFEFISKR